MIEFTLGNLLLLCAICFLAGFFAFFFLLVSICHR